MALWIKCELALEGNTNTCRETGRERIGLFGGSPTERLIGRFLSGRFVSEPGPPGSGGTYIVRY